MKKIPEPKELFDVNPVYYDGSEKRFLVKTYSGWYELNFQDILRKFGYNKEKEKEK
jgi:hypothetical protein